MNIEQNKRIAAEFFARFSANNVPGALDLVADDVTWWLAGKSSRSRTGGTYDKAKIAGLFERLVGRLKNGLRMEVKSAIGEADRVAIEVESSGELTNGRRYNNEYHFLMTLRDGKIVAVREYNDTLHAFETFFEQN